ncbi:M20/M25/M40 family metallo-hydrolase [Dongia sp.]|uniref:M20/M25/M40 family metallo-hydrolase n=1 Tax=Dongia sp. TaxID=1977262 RepID=UPI0037500F1B
MQTTHNLEPALQTRPDRAEYWALRMTELPSVSGSAEEAAFPQKLTELLRKAPPFRDHPENVWTIPVPGGKHQRGCVAALVRGRGRRTVVLTGHFDTVPIEDYGDLKPLARQAEDLRQGLLSRLRQNAVTRAEKLALLDLSTSDYLPGRGLLDMKAGLAAGLAVLEAFAELPEREGNLLFLTVPDEEVNSAGARAAAPALPEICAKHGLDIVAAINLDAIHDEGDGSTGRAVALGTIGKLLPSAMVVGLPTHAGYAFNGLNACVLAGALAAEVEWAEALTERAGEQTGAGPTLLGMKDSKTAYDVTMPDKVWMFWNVMLYRHTAAAILEALQGLAESAVAKVQAALARRRIAALGTAALPEVTVTTFEALRREVCAARPDAAAALDRYAKEIAAQNLDLPEQCRLITSELWKLSGRGDPAIILGFASTPYLATQLGADADARNLARATETAAEIIAARHNTTIALPAYFLGISDMSFLGQADESEIPLVAANTPAWGAGLHWPQGNAFAGIPIVNAGPWGRDYHTVLERLHTPYAFKVLPDLIGEIVSGVFRSKR